MNYREGVERMIFASVNAMFWTDVDVIDNFTPEDKYFYLYLLTCPYTNVSGCFEISLKQAATELGYSRDTVDRLIDRFVNVHKVIDYDVENKEVLIINWGKYHWTTSDKYQKALEKKISSIKTKRFKEFLSSLFNEYCKCGSFDTVSIRYQYGMDTTYIYSYPIIDNPVIENGNKREEGVGEEREEGVIVFNSVNNGVEKSIKSVVKRWNQTRFRKVARLDSSSQRYAWLRARIMEYGIDEVMRAIDIADSSNFLMESSWFDFEWFVRPNNFVKVLEGKYNRENDRKTGNPFLASLMEDGYECS